MWLYHKETRAYGGQQAGSPPSDFMATSVEPPAYRAGYMLAFGHDSRWIEVAIPSVTRAQGRLAIHRAGLLEQLEAVIASADMEARIWYEDAQEWERDHHVVEQMRLALGLTHEQIDELFLSV